MTTPSKSTWRIAGIVLVVVGVGLLAWGYQGAQSIGNELTEAISGSPTDAVVYRYIGGAAALAAGLYALLGRR